MTAGKQMGLAVFIDGVKLGRVFSGPFYAIRIGTGKESTIILADKTPGVHQHHCTIVHTGSTYRLEMLPGHLVFVDGERGECGQQLFLNSASVCLLSIGGAGSSRREDSGLKKFAPPPQIRLERVDEDTSRPALRPDHSGPATNLDLSRFVRVSIRNIVTFGIPALLILLGLGAFGLYSNYASAAALQERIDAVAKLTDLPPNSDVTKRAREAVVQIGLLGNCDYAAAATAENWSVCDFYPAGTAWMWDRRGIWDAEGDTALVTNIHVVKAINDCATATTSEARDKCVAPANACPALRYFVGDARTPTLEPLVACGEKQRIPALVHADHETFERWAQRAAAGSLPNVYDVAVIGLPANLKWRGSSLPLAEADDPEHRKLEAGRGVGLFGYPSEGGLLTDWNAGAALFRPGVIGRTQDPFGLPSDEEYLITISGPEVVGGESGGPVIDRDGRVVAMTFANFSQAGDAQLGRIAYGARMKALDTRLLADQSQFVASGSNGLPVSQMRLRLWSAGLERMSSGRRQAVIDGLNAQVCPAGFLPHPREPETRLVRANVATQFIVSEAGARTDGSDGLLTGWSYSEDLAFTGDAGETSHIVVMAISSGPQPRQVMLSYRRGQYKQQESSDPTLTFAAVRDEVSRTASAKASFMLFTPGESARDVQFDLEIHQVDCVRGGRGR